MDINKLYKTRFKENDLDKKNRIWEILCKHFFAKFINKADTILDIASGHCEFINNIQANNKIALDINEKNKQFANSDVCFITDSCFDIKSIDNNSIDVVFISNFLEHLNNKQEVFNVLKEARRVLKINGKILIIQPNIKYVKGEYWDFFDHTLPLTDKSLTEALMSLDYKIEKVIPKFLPYSTKSNLPQLSIFIILYLHLPIVWNIFGKQSFIVGRKN